MFKDIIKIRFSININLSSNFKTKNICYNIKYISPKRSIEISHTKFTFIVNSKSNSGMMIYAYRRTYKFTSFNTINNRIYRYIQICRSYSFLTYFRKKIIFCKSIVYSFTHNISNKKRRNRN